MAAYSRVVKVPLTIVVAIVCAFAIVGLLFFYNQTLISSLSPNSIIFRFNTCARRPSSSPNKPPQSQGERIEVDDSEVEAEGNKLEYDPDICEISEGKWVFNPSLELPYTDESCPYVERQFSCGKNGRNDTDYRYWEWHPNECTLPRFNPELALKKLRGKRLMFVGDSLQRNQWESFVCLVEYIIPQDQKSFKRGRVHSVFRAKEYNTTIEFYWAPFMIESNSDQNLILDPKKRILKVDSVAKHAKSWSDVDILAFNSYVWWVSSLKIKALWGSFANGDDGYEELDTAIAYKIALRTWANWLDSTIDPNKTRIFFTTISPTHTRAADWGKKEGIKCFNETKPVQKKEKWGISYNTAMMNAVADVVSRMKVHVNIINVTQLSEYRVDGHSSIWTETGGNLLTEEQKADPLHHADCIHWCLPGVPDTWNQILLTHLLLL